MKVRLTGTLATLLTAVGLSNAEPPAQPSPITSQPSQHLTKESAPLWPTTPCDTPAKAARVWVDAEYLLWQIKDNPLPTPLTTAALAPFDSPNPGALGDPNTAILIGGGDLDTKWRQGARLTIGAWLDDEGKLGVESSYFFLMKRTESRFAASGGDPIIGFAFNDAAGLRTLTGDPGETFIANSIPGIAAGRSDVTISNSLQGGELNALFNLVSSCNCRVDLLGGVRVLELEEELRIYNDTIGTGPAAGFNAFAVDQFDTRNRFYGGQLGLRGQMNRGKLFLSTTGKVALGTMQSSVDTYGLLRTEDPLVGATVFPSGIYAQPSNSGHRDDNTFAVVPEVSAKVGVNVTKNITAFAGYSFLYVSDVARPGEQIDRNLDLTQSALFGPGLSGASQPAPLIEQSDFWAHGLNLGVQLRW